MNTIERAKKIMLSPKTEWQVIDTEETTTNKPTTMYLILLALIPAIGWLIGYGLIGYNVLGVHIGSVSAGIRQAVISYASNIASAYLTAYIITMLAGKFQSKGDFSKAFQLVVYSYTPMFLAGALYIIPSLGTLAGIVGLYGLYILYLGIAPMMKTPEEKVTPYYLSSIVCVILVFFLFSTLLSALYIQKGITF
ncbi:Yip1 family protein [uncultured Bacteroides sp.]|uniref:Yip1 family protein n=1 Tax=uncultured Bacteroides sp. TaxID=162156 RepID=UPI002AAC1F06|nr:Yip1 family protein [uncultured Bacteroides sp.]